jgi:hypothetical protein
MNEMSGVVRNMYGICRLGKWKREKRKYLGKKEKIIEVKIGGFISSRRASERVE